MTDLTPKPSKKPGDNRLKVTAHFEPLKADMLDETLEILASIICDYVERGAKSERKKDSVSCRLCENKHG